MGRKFIIVDGNEAVARIAYQTNEVIAIYPITPASPMGEWADAEARRGRKNLWGLVPDVIEMQSEAGAAGAVHGALQTGALATTFTASQGLLLMVPNMFKIAGELTPTVFHVAARTIATHALSIFGDHSDVMAARSTGFAMLCSRSVQEAHDLALIAQSTTYRTRVPFLHFFDGFRTSHEIARIEEVPAAAIRTMVEVPELALHRGRALDSEAPCIRGTAQNPDVFFQAREACNPYHDQVPVLLQQEMERFAELTGRRYSLFEYEGDPEAERVVVIMGSGSGAVKECVAELCRRGQRVGVLTVRLFRPFSVADFCRALPRTTAAVAVLDRTKEPGSVGEPLYQEVVAALHEGWEDRATSPQVSGGRYGLSSKEFTPAMAASVFRHLSHPERRHFTVGIVDDVTHLSLPVDPDGVGEPTGAYRAAFFGLGSDGTVGATKSSAKILSQQLDQFVQGYFVYDSKKSGSITESQLRLHHLPIHSSYLVEEADYVGCHQSSILECRDVLGRCRHGGTLVVNSPLPAGEFVASLPRSLQSSLIEKQLRVRVVDASQVAREAGLGGLINTVMQTAFFLECGLLEADEAVKLVKASIEKAYGRRGRSVVERNHAAVDATRGRIQPVRLPEEPLGERELRPLVPEGAPDFVTRVTALMLAGLGDRLPVSALPVDGTFAVGTAKYERRSIASEIPLLDPDLCIQCGLCALVCPHAAIRAKVFPPEAAQKPPADFPTLAYKGHDWSAAPEGSRFALQVAPDDCTGCSLCVEMCPARSKEVARHKAINMVLKEPVLQQQREYFDYFLTLPDRPRAEVNTSTVQGSQLIQPLFEFSGACAGCGETPYLKLLTQLFGDRMLVANATGCSSIYGGNLPTTPWSADSSGRGPAWSNSLFEDNAEFGLGMRLALDRHRQRALDLLEGLSGKVPAEWIEALRSNPQRSDAEIAAQRSQLELLHARLESVDPGAAREFRRSATHLVRRSVWLVGGDGWAYDIGFGGLDHVLASGRDVNILVLDTEVYSNTGGQASKATPLGAIAKFAANGKSTGKKDLGMIATAYGSVYVAQVALGANPRQTIETFREAEAHPGPSLLIAYSQCIAHGLDMSKGMEHQKDAVRSGYWPLFRFDPGATARGAAPFRLDSRPPSLPFREFARTEARFALLAQSDPARSAELLAAAQEGIERRFKHYQGLTALDKPDAGPSGSTP